MVPMPRCVGSSHFSALPSLRRRYVDNSQGAADAALTSTLLRSTHSKLGPVAMELLTVLKSFDPRNTGHLTRHDLLAGCAALGVVLSESELNCLTPVFKTDASGNVDYNHFCGIFS